MKEILEDFRREGFTLRQFALAGVACVAFVLACGLAEWLSAQY